MKQDTQKIERFITESILELLDSWTTPVELIEKIELHIQGTNEVIGTYFSNNAASDILIPLIRFTNQLQLLLASIKSLVDAAQSRIKAKPEINRILPMLIISQQIWAN